jgi:hypothetical protein
MDDQHRRIVRLAALAGALALLCAAAGVAALLLRPPPPRTQQEQIARALAERRVEVRAVELGEQWPDRINRQYGIYAGPITMAVTVHLADGGRAAGWLECRELERDCALTLRRFAMDDVPLPNLAAPDEPAWLEWVRERLPRLG